MRFNCHKCGCLLAIQHEEKAIVDTNCCLQRDRGGCFCEGCCDKAPAPKTAKPDKK